MCSAFMAITKKINPEKKQNNVRLAIANLATVVLLVFIPKNMFSYQKETKFA